MASRTRWYGHHRQGRLDALTLSELNAAAAFAGSHGIDDDTRSDLDTRHLGHRVGNALQAAAQGEAAQDVFASRSFLEQHGCRKLIGVL